MNDWPSTCNCTDPNRPFCRENICSEVAEVGQTCLQTSDCTIYSQGSLRCIVQKCTYAKYQSVPHVTVPVFGTVISFILILVLLCCILLEAFKKKKESIIVEQRPSYIYASQDRHDEMQNHILARQIYLQQFSDPPPLYCATKSNEPSPRYSGIHNANTGEISAPDQIYTQNRLSSGALSPIQSAYTI